jgi:type I restriction enzyme S subunit
MSDALFAIPGLWEPTTLGEICRRGGGDIQTGPFGSQLHASDYVPCGIPSIMPQNIGDNRISEDGIARITADDALRLSRYLVRCGDIVYSRRGDVERRALIREREDGWLCGTGCLRIRFGNGVVHPPYVAFYLGHPLVREWIVRHAHGATMPNLNTSILSALPFVLPPLEEQRAIAHILGTLDDKIELNRRTNETLEAMARAIFKSWFVDFDPVRAKASGEPPKSICRRLGLTPEFLALFPNRLEESELGEIPTGWVVSTIDGLAQIVGGGTPSTKEEVFWKDGQNYWATPKDLSKLATPVLLATERKISDLGLSQIGSGLLPRGTVLLSSRAPIGYRAITEVPVAINQGFIAMQPNKGVSRLFLLYWAEWAHQEIISRANGSTFLEISKGSFRPIPLVTPPDSIFRAFDQILGPVYGQIVSNECESILISEERDTLLPQLLSGKLSVPVEEIMP